MQAPPVAKAYARRLQRERDDALGSIAVSWSRMTSDFDASWQQVRPAVISTLLAAQLEVARAADEFVPEVVKVTAPRAAVAEYGVSLAAWRGLAGDGRSVETLASGAVIQAKRAVQKGFTVPQALSLGGRWLDKAMGTVLSDTHRGVEQMGAHSRRVGRYVRMVAGRSTCGRCVILAGRIYRTQQAFERHPSCDCVHVPAAENVAGDLMTNPGDYLDSLSDDELAKTLGSKANAEAYRDGADVNQLINAYRRKGAVYKAQDFRATTEGLTRRGWARQSMSTAGLGWNAPRLMPSSIYELATSREDAIRLLRTYGWIL